MLIQHTPTHTYTIVQYIGSAVLQTESGQQTQLNYIHTYVHDGVLVHVVLPVPPSLMLCLLPIYPAPPPLTLKSSLSPIRTHHSASPLPGAFSSTTVIKGGSGLRGGVALVGGDTLREVSSPTPCRTTRTTVDPASFSACTAWPWVTFSIVLPLTLKIWSSILHKHTHTQACTYMGKLHKRTRTNNSKIAEHFGDIRM